MEQFTEIAEVKSSDVSMESVVDELFGGTATSFTLRNGTVVTFKQAKFKQIAVITRLFQQLLDRIPKDKFATMLGLIVNEQAKAMADGKSQTDISLNATGMIEAALGQNSLLLTVFTNVLDLLPEAVPQFCDLKKEQFEDLDLDEAVLVATGIVAVNYSFFTQTLPPLLKSVLGGWQKKSGTTVSTERSTSLTSTVSR